jgi:hypothetical protein
MLFLNNPRMSNFLATMSKPQSESPGKYCVFAIVGELVESEKLDFEYQLQPNETGFLRVLSGV